MDEYRENVKKVQKALNQDAAFIQPNPYLAQRVLNAVNAESYGKGGIVVKRKMPIALVVAVVLMLSGIVAVAATILNLHIEKAMDITRDKGSFSAWEYEDKIALIDTMIEAGIVLPREEYNIILDPASSDEEKNQAATELLAGIYGSEEHISHFTIASHDWGDPFQWTLEQKEWFWETLRAKGLYTGDIKYLLPDENDLTRDQVVVLAKQAIQDAYDLPDEIVDSYDADVTFFSIIGMDDAPRWRVYLGYVDAEAAEYTVLLTQDGQVTEDASLNILKPEVSAKLAAQSNQPSTVLKPYEKRMLTTDELYLSENNKQYHFLSDCPSVADEKKASADDLDGYDPCPYCVLQTQLWSAEEQIVYGAMYGELPSENMISSTEAETIAFDYLFSCGNEDVRELVPYSRYYVIDDKPQYVVFFARLENELINPMYSVTVDAVTGEIIKYNVLSDSNG